MKETLPSRNFESGWVKSRKSVAASACVQLCVDEDTMLVRDSKDPEGPSLRYTWAEMDAFFDGVKKGEFDELVRRLMMDEDRATSSPSALPLSAMRVVVARVLALPVTVVGWMNALFFVLAALIVSLSLVTRFEVLQTSVGGVVTLVALLVLAASRRMPAFGSRHLQG